VPGGRRRRDGLAGHRKTGGWSGHRSTDGSSGRRRKDDPDGHRKTGGSDGHLRRDGQAGRHRTDGSDGHRRKDAPDGRCSLQSAVRGRCHDPRRGQHHHRSAAGGRPRPSGNERGRGRSRPRSRRRGCRPGHHCRQRCRTAGPRCRSWHRRLNHGPRYGHPGLPDGCIPSAQHRPSPGQRCHQHARARPRSRHSATYCRLRPLSRPPALNPSPYAHTRAHKPGHQAPKPTNRL
jgi:hypothetical protein